ncbi:MAG: hypothetical protein ACO1RX_06200 [Candidatus Sericytochromatia bacterium]
MSAGFFRLSLSLLLTGSVLSACSPAVNQPTAAVPGNTATPNTATPNTVTSPGTSATGNVTAPPAAVTASGSINSAAELEASLKALVADETTLRDAQLASEAGFATQALGIEGKGEINATAIGPVALRAGANATVRPAVRAQLKANTKTQAQAKAQQRLQQAKQKKAALEASGALSVNADGSVTIQPAALKSFVKQTLQTRKATFEARVAKVRAALADRKEIAQERLSKLRRQNNVVRSSETEEVTNADGSITAITTLEFNNTRSGVTRTVTRSETQLEGKLISSHYEMQITGPNGYTRSLTRAVEILADGSRKVSVEGTTTWAGGKKRERSEERIVSADGSATGSGVITVTLKDGTTKSFDYTLGIDAAGSISVEGDDAPDSSSDAGETVEVSVVDEANSSEATVVVETESDETEVTLDLSADTDVTEDSETPDEASAG